MDRNSGGKRIRIAFGRVCDRYRNQIIQVATSNDAQELILNDLGSSHGKVAQEIGQFADDQRDRVEPAEPAPGIAGHGGLANGGLANGVEVGEVGWIKISVGGPIVAFAWFFTWTRTG